MEGEKRTRFDVHARGPLVITRDVSAMATVARAPTGDGDTRVLIGQAHALPVDAVRRGYAVLGLVSTLERNRVCGARHSSTRTAGAPRARPFGV